MSSQAKPLILVDGSSYLYRAFHALPALMNSKGFPTGAIYGMINMLKRLLNDYHPEILAVVFDAKGRTFRDDLYAEYKATRSAMPDELSQQIAPLHKMIAALGLPLVMVEGVEADDVIGTIAKEASRAGFSVLISTSDKDFAQLVTSQITLVNTMTNTELNPDTVRDKFGVPPETIIDYLILVGDTSDNIPGVPKVGPKTAAKWLQHYGSLENIIAHAHEISGKVGENLRVAITQFSWVRDLVTIKTDIPLQLTLSDLKIKQSDTKNLINYYKEMEFKAWLAELLKEKTEDTINQNEFYTIINNKHLFTEFSKELMLVDIFSLQVLTSDEVYMDASIIGLSVAINAEKAVYIPFLHHYPDCPSQLDKRIILSELKPLLENKNIKKLTYDSKFLKKIFANEGIDLQGIDYDILLESYILDSTPTAHSLHSLALKYLGIRINEYAELAGKGSKQQPCSAIDIKKAAFYAAETTVTIFKLHEVLWHHLQEISAASLLNTIEMPLFPVLTTMERAGVLIDAKKLKTQEKAWAARLQVLEEEAFLTAGKSFNLNSPKQLQIILFEELKLPVLQKTPTGQPSTADAVLQELALDFAMPHLIIEYRSLSKLMSTYTTRLIEQINTKTGRVHTTYHQTGTSTGRLSSSDPNLQNIPIRTEEGRRIRQAFIAQSGFKILSADYSQIELRLMAHISKDPQLLQAFQRGLDIHTATAAEVAGIPLDQVTPEMRRNAKAINFGLLYGMSAFGLTRQLGIDRQAAQNYIDLYFSRYPKVKAYMDNTRLTAKEYGYVETLFGRRLYIPDINASQIPRQKAAERAAINAPLQGTAAEIIKLAMIKIHAWIVENNIPANMIMQVHDELVFEVRNDVIAAVQKKVSELMTTIIQLEVPIEVSVGLGDNWDDASKH